MGGRRSPSRDGASDTRRAAARRGPARELGHGSAQPAGWRLCRGHSAPVEPGQIGAACGPMPCTFSCHDLHDVTL